jgi:hypothetical protein
MRKELFMAASALAALSALDTAQGATITLSPQYVGAYNGNTLLGTGNPNTFAPGTKFRFNVLLTVNGAVAGEDFRATTFSVLLGSGLTKATTNWTPANAIFEPDPINDPGTTAAVWSNNADGGANTTDLLSIFVAQTDSIIADSRQVGESPRPKFGTDDNLGSPTRIGRFEAVWDGTTTTSLSFTPVGTAPVSFFLGNGEGSGTVSTPNTTSTFSASSFAFTPVPEPTAIGLAAVGGLGLLARRRRAI